MAATRDAPAPLDPNFRIELPSFEGPLDLLLHLIKQHELDILDLPIAFVTERYLDYLGLMKRLHLDIAAEYLVMAATLAHIKSKLLLPTPPSDQDDEDEEDGIDPREELIRRLLQYQKYKAAAADLGARGLAGRDVFPRGSDAPRPTGDPPLAEVGLFKLLEAFQRVLDRKRADLTFEVTAERITIQERITQVTERLRGRKNATFDELFDDVHTTYDVVVTFLALLEMAKQRMARLYQPEAQGPIRLEVRILGEEDAGAGQDEPTTEGTTSDDAAEATTAAPPQREDDADPAR
ncbi:MAG TPA: segregation/condensation protein A [Polyangiaceae bacterium LLY-WYZ-14_1]|nr:segregation/condensation protein A [Polyangiaceae bacterium LLY-WYZ-14_1]